MEPYRIFLSYSHEDMDKATEVARVLEELGLKPKWDDNIRPGSAFTDAIKGMIAHSHIFMPLITKKSKDRPWVHQETGYAMALNIPVLPLAIGDIPDSMIAHLQAITIEEDLDGLEDILNEEVLKHIVDPLTTKPLEMIEVANWPEQRVEAMSRCAYRVLELDGPTRLLQRGSLSSFSIPDADFESPIWAERDGDTPRSNYYHHLLQNERQALEAHAREAGCDLMFYPKVTPSGGFKSRRRTADGNDRFRMVAFDIVQRRNCIGIFPRRCSDTDEMVVTKR